MYSLHYCFRKNSTSLPQEYASDKTIMRKTTPFSAEVLKLNIFHVSYLFSGNANGTHLFA